VKDLWRNVIPPGGGREKDNRKTIVNRKERIVERRYVRSTAQTG
jgi:hypothetical protein